MQCCFLHHFLISLSDRYILLTNRNQSKNSPDGAIRMKRTISNLIAQKIKITGHNKQLKTS
ncbi:hypothetical protein C4E49_19770 [Morganella morganii]|uniref:Uncharacterized protein n=1 Tax=Morganella morganii TaxID=582 RepID=A0A2C5TSG1_MORMO|nr:hypothetical protein C4E49_19770 [Morganella morganii]CDK68428.1 hypothetical protein [Morganella morganii IS15]MBE8613598.1 hypothetical protein [Morganella morganii]OPL27687.1 hypothetical protein B5S45_00830 [Morganella morganii]PCP72844.1 hypothetical protein CQA25_12215 [Morganella morganii]